MNDWFGVVRELLDLRAVRDLPARGGADQHVRQVSITAMLNTISAYWHMVGVAFIVVVLIIVPDQHQSLRLRLHARR